MSRTALNRNLGRTFVLYMCGQTILATGGWLAGVSPTQLHLFFLFAWSLTYGLVGVWAEPWFGVPAAACAVSFVIASAFPAWTYALMSVCNLLLTIVVLRVWVPREPSPISRAGGAKSAVARRSGCTASGEARRASPRSTRRDARRWRRSAGLPCLSFARAPLRLRRAARRAFHFLRRRPRVEASPR